MHIISNTQYKLKVEPILRQVFINDNPCDKPFSPKITSRKIIYPCYNYLEKPFLYALIDGSFKSGDSGCYLSQLLLDENRPNHCYIPLSELLDGYTAPPYSKSLIEVKLDIDLLSEYVLYSAKGKWGFMVSDEHHGLLGGSSKFMKNFHKFIPDIDLQVYSFLGKYQEAKRSGSSLTLDWLSHLLSHVYGQETAKKLLQETNLF